MQHYFQFSYWRERSSLKNGLIAARTYDICFTKSIYVWIITLIDLHTHLFECVAAAAVCITIKVIWPYRSKPSHQPSPCSNFVIILNCELFFARFAAFFFFFD